MDILLSSVQWVKFSLRVCFCPTEDVEEMKKGTFRKQLIVALYCQSGMKNKKILSQSIFMVLYFLLVGS